MRIVQVAQWYIPEYGYQEYFLADAWQRQGHQVYTIASTHIYPRTRFAHLDGLVRPRKIKPGLYEEYGTQVYRLPSVEIRHRTLLSPGLERLVRSLKPDLVLVHGITNLNPLRMALLKRRMGQPFRLLCDEHMTYSVLRQDRLGRAFYGTFRRLFTGRLVRSVDTFVPLCRETQDILLRHYGIPEEKTRVIPWGVDLRRFYRSDEERQATRQRLGIGDEDVALLYAGKLSPAKGTPALVEAALRVLPTHPSMYLVLVGSGEQRFVEGLKARLREAGLDSRVHRVGYVPNEELRHYFSAADIGLWPAEESMTMLEAACCELPVICNGSSPLNGERFGNGAGFLFHSFDDMVSIVERLVEDPCLRRATGARGREAASRHSWDGVAAQFLEA